ncbi:hypothetical protein At1D1609_54520 (plasmid) [Agrobacterium tumefaciens]|uniref:Uncharacterized protein n=1 Tax=Agrobacterium tumefaciens TaxID=358 RepID=A0A2L2LMC5_AGRTU|nr:hypothetical protein At1D1609_54520 [Agrobacterium tumefaciens]
MNTRAKPEVPTHLLTPNIKKLRMLVVFLVSQARHDTEREEASLWQHVSIQIDILEGQPRK